MEHLEILKFLNENYSANFYLVGGFVRNLLQGKKTTDYDVATDLLPGDVVKKSQELGIKAFPTGIKHGTVTILINSHPIEVTTFRRDLENNGRFCRVEYTKSMEEDSGRRDFTINAIYMDQNGKIYDFYYSQSDLKEGIVRFIGNPRRRIQEDYLRILRFFRFYAEVDKDQKSLTKDLIQALNSEIKNIAILSKERISQELLKTTSLENFTKAFDGMLKVEEVKKYFNLSDEIANYKNKNVEYVKDWNNFEKLCLINIYNIEELASKSRYRWSNKELAFVKKLAKVKNEIFGKGEIFNINFEYGNDFLNKCLIIRYFIGMYTEAELKKHLEKSKKIKDIRFEVTGKDLLDLGFGSGKSLGIVLEKIEKYWLENNFPSKQECLEFARKFLKKHI